MPEPPRIFVSHSNLDNEFTERLVGDLQAAGAHVWVDYEQIASGDFARSINEGLGTCEWVVLVQTPNALNSSWVEMEINAAVNLGAKKKHVKAVIPIIAADCTDADIPAIWDALHNYDATKDYDRALKGLLRAVGLNPKTTSRSTEVDRPKANSQGGSVASQSKKVEGLDDIGRVEPATEPKNRPIAKADSERESSNRARLNSEDIKASPSSQEKPGGLKAWLSTVFQPSAENLFETGEQFWLGSNGKKDIREAVSWYEKAAAQGHCGAMNRLGKIFSGSEGIEPDLQKSFEWTRRSAEGGDPLGMYNLGLMFRDGVVAAKNLPRALEWFQKAAAAGLGEAMNQAGLAYQQGSGVEKDDARAVRWFRQGAEAGNRHSTYNLGFMYKHGMGVMPNETEAFNLFLKAAGADVTEAMNQVGMAYAEGRGVPKNERKALEWYSRSADGKLSKRDDLLKLPTDSWATRLETVDWLKVGRNDPCPCGSGKKFKFCHYSELRAKGEI